MTSKSIAFLIVLYKKEINESGTIRTLASSGLDFSGCNLTIWNNGPKELNSKNVDSLRRVGMMVDILETVDNESLATIYNTFISRLKAEKYVILDDDSLLTRKYLDDVFCSKSCDLSVPIIRSGDIVRSPEVKGKSLSEFGYIDDVDGLKAIGSGLVIGSKVVDLFIEKFESVFDSRFYLYGVDTTFFIRLKRLRKVPKVRLINGFQHSLSRLEPENYQVKYFRSIERACDCALTIRYYEKNKFVSKFKLVKISLLLFYKKLKEDNIPFFDLKAFVKCAISGKHYRHAEKKIIKETSK